MVTIAIFVLISTLAGYSIFLIIGPDELERSESMFSFSIRAFLTIWFFYSIVFHYIKARILCPVKHPGVPGDAFCKRCNDWKGEETHHCSGCDSCIWKMDHHCPHIGQCVGAHNQAHFFLFLFNLWVGPVLFLLMTYGFWNRHISRLSERKEAMSGDCKVIFCLNVWFTVISTDDESNGKLSLFLVLMVFLSLCMFAFVMAYSFMIAGGSTYLMKLSGKPKKPWTWRVAVSRARKYFNMDSDETFLTLLFIPRSRKEVKYMEDGMIGVWV